MFGTLLSNVQLEGGVTVRSFALVKNSATIKSPDTVPVGFAIVAVVDEPEATALAALTVGDTDTDGEREGLRLGLNDGDFDGLRLGDFDGERLGERDGDNDGDNDVLGDTEGLFEGLRDVEGDSEGDTDGENEADGESDVLGDCDGLNDGERDGLAEGDRDGERDGEAETPASLATIDHELLSPKSGVPTGTCFIVPMLPPNILAVSLVFDTLVDVSTSVTERSVSALSSRIVRDRDLPEPGAFDVLKKKLKRLTVVAVVPSTVFLRDSVEESVVPLEVSRP